MRFSLIFAWPKTSLSRKVDLNCNLSCSSNNLAGGIGYSTHYYLVDKHVVDEGSFFVGFGAIIPRMANVPTDFTRHV